MEGCNIIYRSTKGKYSWYIISKIAVYMLAHFWPKLFKCFNEVKIPYLAIIIFCLIAIAGNMKHTDKIKQSEGNK